MISFVKYIDIFRHNKMKLIYLFISILWSIVFSPIIAWANELDQKDPVIEEDIRIIESKKKDVSIPRRYGFSQVEDWQVLDNKHIVLEITGRKKFKATFMNSCHGIRFTEIIALSTMGPFELDKFTTIILPDGQRCHIKELIPYTVEMEQQDKLKRNENSRQVPE